MSRTVRLALLQLRAFDVEDAEASLQHTLERIDDAATLQPDIIVTPEMTYPAYFLQRADLAIPGVRPPAEVAALFAAKAREHRVHIAAGIALEGQDGGYANAAILFGRDGGVLGTYAKTFLWHFDRKWFTGGGAYPVIETDVGRIGMLICADGRMPEIARCLALGGAQLILDLTAWVSGGRRAQDLTSPQRVYLLQTRAAENGVWIAAADKVGIEAQSIVYCGGSCVIDPRGSYVARLGSEEEGILSHDVELEDARPRMLRRPELYGALLTPTDELPVERAREEPLVPGAYDRNIAVVQMRMPADGEQFVATARRHAERLALQDVRLALFPATPSRLRGAYPHDAVLGGMNQIARDTGLLVAFTVSEPDQDGWRAMYLVGPQGVLAKHRQTHRPSGPKFDSMPMGDTPCPVIETELGRIGLLVAAEGFVPEVARSLMLRGAELLLWSADDPPLPMSLVARTRADENRVYVGAAAAPTLNGSAMIVAPSGAVVAEALEGRDLAVSATVNRVLARLKERAPGTDVVRGRQPGTYDALVAAERQPAPTVV
jgi:predicted amidohydrolase